MSFIIPWSQSESFQLPRSCLFLNRPFLSIAQYIHECCVTAERMPSPVHKAVTG